MDEQLIFLALKYNGDYNQIKKAIESNETNDIRKIRQILSVLPFKCVTVLNDDYPRKLRALKDPPFVLFYYGDLSLCEKACMSMIGMRKCSEYGRKVAKELVEGLRDDYVIVSGMAKGIDGVCHSYAYKTIAVLGCGIDYCYPKSHIDMYRYIKQFGLVLSEYPLNISPKKYYFPWRNRIVAALGDGLIVVEASKKSGTMITVGYALELGKNVFAVPCRIDDASGTLSLIKDGAFCIENVQDVYDVMNLEKNS